MTSVAAVIIGDEILTGKIQDTNTPLLIELCANRGATLRRVSVIGDAVGDIADEVKRCSERHDLVITSGGVGPTHDDCTVEGVARAFEVGVEQCPEVEEMIRRFWGRRFTESALRMASMPKGSTLLYGGDGLLPLVQFRNVILFPGVPELFAAKLPSVRNLIGGTPLASVNVYLNSDESRVAPLLDAVNEDHPDVTIGSYPRFARSVDHRLWIVFEATEVSLARSAAEQLLRNIEDDEVVRVDSE
jgi:molybdenum cofactor synthesis domain-containing protein